MTTRSPKNIQFPIVWLNNAPVIQMPRRLTVLEAVRFKETCHQLLAQPFIPCQIILNFSQTLFIDSSGIGALVHNYKATREKNIDLVLCDVHPPVMAVLSMTGLDEILTITTETLAQTENTAPSCPIYPIETHPSVRCRLKRGIDILGGMVGLGVLGILLLPIAIIIKLDSPGPIFFTQVRCGWLGKRFKIIKFRSMCFNAEAIKHTIPNQAKGAFFKNTHDPRITKVGQFLRRTSLDELPQFWNVIKGEMSLVGTRPPTPDEVERYEVPQWQRLNVKPGMTGEWQVHGRSTVQNFEEVIQLDLRYQRNWSLFYDLQLIWKTILIVFRKNSGAY